MKGIVYYACNTHPKGLDEACRIHLMKSDMAITCISLNKDLIFGDTHIQVNGEKGPLMMHKQILLGLESCNYDHVFLCETDVLYHPSHFDFTPPDDAIWYNNNVWKVRLDDGFTFRTNDMKQVSGICASRDVLLDFYTKRVKQIEEEGFNRHFEPGLKQSVGSKDVKTWDSEYPNICIRHDSNITKSKFSPEEFRNAQYAEGWREADEIPGWGKTGAEFSGILKMV